MERIVRNAVSVRSLEMGFRMAAAGFVLTATAAAQTPLSAEAALRFMMRRRSVFPLGQCPHFAGILV